MKESGLLGYHKKRGKPFSFPLMCGWRDSNPHAVKHQILSLACLPISPHPQTLGGLQRYYFLGIKKMQDERLYRKVSIYCLSISYI